MKPALFETYPVFDMRRAKHKYRYRRIGWQVNYRSTQPDFWEYKPLFTFLLWRARHSPFPTGKHFAKVVDWL